MVHITGLNRHISSCLLVFITIFISHVLCGTRDMKEMCKLCKSVTDSFNKLLQDTAKSNFGGGNTRWEEKSLGSYAFSETRFLEITESLCQKTTDEKKCHHVLELNEELLEHFWFKVFKKNPDVDLYKWLCLDNKQADEFKDSSLYEPVCCKSGQYGPKCSPCSGGETTPCSGRGKCDGDATRGGTGKCLCDTGYRGDVCNECSESYYSSGNVTDSDNDKTSSKLVCSSCHISCKSCTGGGEMECLECRNGYNKIEEEGKVMCEDVNECQNKTICESGKYCSNTVGSYVCMACDPACDQCLGGGPDKCIKCQKGYVMEDNKCVDPNAPKEEEEEEEKPEEENEANDEAERETKNSTQDEDEKDDEQPEVVRADVHETSAKDEL